MLKFFCKSVIRVLGWELIGGDGPKEPRSVLIASPHTSNWDWFYMMLAAGSWDVPFRWMGKEDLFTGWYGWMMPKLGGIPVIRDSPQGMVQQMALMIKNSEAVALAVPASATRKYTDMWKSGFYHIANAADVPVIPAFVDYGTKTVGIGPAVSLTGDVTADMDVFREFYGPKTGKYPEADGPVLLKEELLLSDGNDG